ncbi:MAG TPA: hypothetical protein VFU05_09520 [Cyclobacteriaceae bacterium]|nr:hypothetical protein [Cyclobacteriaceae bacterium]
MSLIRVILILVVFTACRSEYSCPPPNSVRLKRMSAHRMKYYKHLMEERALARNKEADVKKLKKANEQEAKFIDVNEWDCPKPGTAHQRQILKLRKKLDKQKEDQLRKRLEKQEIEIPEKKGESFR